MPINFSDIEDAIFFISGQQQGVNSAYLSLTTGQIYYLSGFGDSDELPDDFETSDQYLELPHKNDLDQGRPLVDVFTAKNAPQLTNKVFEIFNRSGAFRNFKGLMEENGLLEKWYEFENNSEALAIKQWCKENKLPIDANSDD